MGRTGHDSTVAVLGAAAFWDATEDEAAEGFALAMRAGVNHLDIAPQYGSAQRVVGPLVPQAVRDHGLFIGCKTLRANPDGVRAQLEESLTLLGVDSFDLYQVHAVTGLDELERRVPAFEAILRAHDEGLCRHVGVTGHDVGAPATHAEAVRRFDLDTVMFPVNPRLWADPAYRHDAEALLALCDERDVGAMAIKAAARRPWPERAERHTYHVVRALRRRAGDRAWSALRPLHPRHHRLLHTRRPPAPAARPRRSRRPADGTGRARAGDGGRDRRAPPSSARLTPDPAAAGTEAPTLRRRRSPACV